ncbi:MAG: hypothetical protein ACXADW_20420 [Candidatus Hodarchaeales archaeon]|jgi:hypothetical protein
MGRRGRVDWHVQEEVFLSENYAKLTIKELKQGLKALEGGRERSADSINAKIKRMKSKGKIEGLKGKETVNRSLIQRRKEI